MTVAMTNHADIQDRVFAFLSDPKHHPGVRRIDTHAASVFLEGSRALKIKRAVRFPFLDYSTLAKRRAACDKEIEINRPFAPQIYHRVVPITRASDGSLSIDGEGTAVEFAVEMTRFDEQQTVDHLAPAGPLQSRLVEAIADKIVDSHRKARRVAADPWIASIPGIIDGNTKAFRAAKCFPDSEIDTLGTASLAAFTRLRSLLERRGRDGYVRRCHGDLHLANIALIDREPVLFDAIEFDETIASTDVIYDLAFPLMDMLRYGQQAAANALLNRYLAATQIENLDALSALPLLMSLRAAIRTHVLLARIDRAVSEKPDLVEPARAYFELARRLMDRRPAALVAIGGLSGTGKSVLARALAPFVMPQPGAVLLRSDVVRKQMSKVAETDRLPACAYQPETHESVYKALAQRAGRVLSQGHSAVVDAVFARESERKAIEAAAHQLGMRFVGFFLVADLTTRQQRVAHRTADASDATAEVARLQESYNIGTVDWAIVDASGTPETTLSQCRTQIPALDAP